MPHSLTAHYSLRSLRTVRQATQPSADRSTRLRRVAPASGWVARPRSCPPCCGNALERTLRLAAASAPQGARNGTGCTALRPCRERTPPPGQAGRAWSGRAGSSCQSRALRVLRSLDSARPAAGTGSPPGRKPGWSRGPSGHRRRSRWARRRAQRRPLAGGGWRCGPHHRRPHGAPACAPVGTAPDPGVTRGQGRSDTQHGRRGSGRGVGIGYTPW